MRFDVVIIGSGLGGLVCGHVLARAGRKVLILERQVQPGGCLQSFRRDGFVFDTGLHTVGGLASGQHMHDRFEQLGLMRLPWRRLDPKGYDIVSIGGETFAHAEGFDNFAATLARRFPSQSAALADFTRLLRNLPSLEEAGEVNAYDYLCRTFSDPLLVNVLSASLLKMELRRESLPLFTFLHVMAGYVQSSWRLAADGGLLVQSLVDDIRHFGGELRCREEVEELVEHDGRITTAICKGGDVFEGDFFISDIHPQLTYDLVRESQHIRRIQRWRVASLQNTFGMFTVSLVLKPGTLPYFNHNKYVYRRPNVWEPPFEAPFATATSPAPSISPSPVTSPSPSPSTNPPTAAVPSASAEGAPSPLLPPIDRVMVSCRVPATGTFTRQIDLLTPMPWALCQPWENTTVGRRGEAYLSMKQQRAQQCVELAETVIPGLSSMIQHQHVSTPLTWRDYNLTPNGSAYGIRKDCRNMLMTNFSPQTPIPNLLLTGQSLVIHGIEGVTETAFATAEAILHNNRQTH